MRPGIILSFLIAIAPPALGCGGSSSETPWPREPEGPALGPAGESAPPSGPADAPEAPAQGAEEGEGDEPPAAPR